jgi:hypothetical protein
MHKNTVQIEPQHFECIIYALDALDEDVECVRDADFGWPQGTGRLRRLDGFGCSVLFQTSVMKAIVEEKEDSFEHERESVIQAVTSAY